MNLLQSTKLSMVSNKNQKVNDFNIHGVVGLRYIGAPPKTVATLAARLGSVVKPDPICEPEIIVHFDPKFGNSSLTYVGSNAAAFAGDSFFLLDKANGAVQVKIPFEQIGTRCEIQCSPQVTMPPFLFEIINLTFLNKGYVPLHAASFNYGDVGIMVAGWPKGGKTGALLAFMNHGAQFLGDEWILISKEGSHILGIPTSIVISEWQFKYIPALMPPIGVQERLFFAGIHFLDGFYNRLGKGRLKKSLFMRMLRKALPSFKRQLRISKFPQTLFPNQIGTLNGRLDKLFLIMNHSHPDIIIEPLDPAEMALRMVHANTFEMQDFFDSYTAFRFSYPHLKNALLENAFAIQQTLLQDALAGKEAYLISHPYGEALEPLFTHMRPYCVQPTASSTPPLHKSIISLDRELS